MMNAPHRHSQPTPTRATWDPLRASARTRLVIACAVSALLWLGVLWVTG